MSGAYLRSQGYSAPRQAARGEQSPGISEVSDFVRPAKEIHEEVSRRINRDSTNDWTEGEADD